jgi:cation:H+ antiporter
VAPLLYIAVGLAGLLLGSAIAVSGALALARFVRVPPLVVGLTLGAVGTSLPEMATNLGVAINTMRGLDAPGLAVGNIVGSCLSQTTLLLGVTAMLGPLSMARPGLKRDGGMACLALALMFLTCLDGLAERWEAATMIVVYAAYLAYVWRTESRAELDEGEAPVILWRTILETVIGIGVVVFSADLIVGSGVSLARAAGIDELIVGLGVGVATGLPELALSLRAIRRGSPGLAIGNLLGSNITDPLLSFGLGALVSPVQIDPDVLWLDFPVWAATTLLALGLLALPKGLGRWGGALLVACFIAYAGLRVVLV